MIAVPTQKKENQLREVIIVEDQFKMIDEIKAETKIFKFINLKTIFFAIGFSLFGYLMSGTVYDSLQLPFIIFNGLVGVILSLPSHFNRGKLIWQSILLYFRSFFNRTLVYHTVVPEDNNEFLIEQSQMMYKELD